MVSIKTYNIAIIGYGAFGRFLKRSWETLPNVRVTSITRTTEDRARESALSDAIPKYSSNYSDILNDPEIDIVSVATPPYLHAEDAIAALKAGKHVLIEKPFATNMHDGQRILEAAERFGRKATVNFIMRYNPVVERLKQVVEHGLLGGLYRTIQENYASSQGLASDHWFWDTDKSGGILVEHGVHFFDLVNWMVGSSPAKVCANLTNRSAGIEDKVMATVEYENRVISTFYNSFSRPAIIEKTFGSYIFDRGEITTNGWIPLDLEMHGLVSSAELAELAEIFDGGEITAHAVHEHEIESSGVKYTVDNMVDIRFELEHDKEAIYAQSAADLLADFIRSIEEPGYKMRVTLDDAYASLKIACEASGYRG